MATTRKVPKVLPTDIARVEARLDRIENMLMRSKEVNPGIASSQSYDITPILALREKSTLLKNLYPDQESRIYQLKDYELNSSSSGYYPSQQRWRDGGLYLGGCEQGSETRRAIIIPMCLSQGLSFFTPQGLSANSTDVRNRIEAQLNCSSAIFDFTGDEFCLNYSAGLDVLFFFAQGFTKLNFLCFPDNILEACMKFDETELGLNLCGPFQNVTLRKRRQEYYEIINLLTCDGWKFFYNSTGPLGLSQALIDQKVNFLKPHNDGIQLTITLRLEIWRAIRAKDWKTDIAHALICLLGMLIFVELKTREHLEINAPEWTLIRGEFDSLLLKSERAAQRLAESDQAELPYDDRYFHMQAFVEMITTVNEAVLQSRHLN